jgi:3-oxoacyl-[acyl-carrier protein] reductase
MDLAGKNVLVTGGANGIGRCLVDRLLSEGANVGVFDLDADGLERLHQEHPEVYTFLCDVSDAEQVQERIAEFVEKVDVIHALVNNAGFIYNAPLVSFGSSGFVKHDVDMWNKVIGVDLSAVFYMTVNVVDRMVARRTRGVVVNISSIAASGNAGQGAYSAAKAGLNALTVAWAKELGPMKIRFVGIAPGFTKTETTLRSVSENMLKDWVKQTPLRRLGAPEEIVDAIVFALSNDFLNGTTVEVDGGLRL